MYEDVGLMVLSKTGAKIYLVKKFPQIVRFVVPQLSSVGIELTNFCNLRCIMCYSRKRAKGFMDIQLFEKVVDELSIAFNNPYIGLHYAGESLLHPEFLDMLAYACSKRSCFRNIGFNTNGMLLTDEIVDALVKFEIGWVTISLDGIGEVNDKLRIGSKYKIIEANILNLLRKRESKPFPKVALNLTVSAQKEKEIMEFKAFWMQYVDNITVNPCHNENLQLISATEKTSNKDYICLEPFRFMGILWNGNVVPCCGDWNGTNILGNVKNATIKEVWRGKKFRNLRYACIKNDFPEDSLCAKCELKKFYGI